jgi:predicted ATPase/transcriptional regulator with XRE-family HTH domain
MLASEVSFGAWIKRRRKALDLTQQELAKRIGCSLSLIFKIESDERRPSRQMVELLAEHLEIPPDQRAIFMRIARQEKTTDRLESVPSLSELTPASIAGSFQPALPLPPASLIGREPEVDAIIRQVQDPACRLLTLVGPGGVGKTSLALEVAHRLRGSFSHGACFVSLVGTQRPEFILTTVAEALGFIFSGAAEPKTQLFNFLKEKDILLVLDNLEHLLEGIEVLSEILEFAPAVTLLATSREQLNLRTEWIFEVQGLPVPSNSEPETFASNSAIALFIQRATQADVGFGPASEDLPAITRICQLVEGLPLGLELAATWVNTLSCQEIAAEIENNLNFLATSRRDVAERHRSMNAVFEYSWNLLSTDEQKLLQQLSLFEGGFQREAAVEVAGATLPLLSALVGKSLIRHIGSGRYDEHELLRQYSAAHLREDRENEIAARDRHAAYYLTLWRDREEQLKSAEQRNALRELVADIDDFRSAWDWAVSRDHFTLLYQCLRSLLIVYDQYGWHSNAIKRLETLLQGLSPDKQSRNAQLYGLALSFQGWFYFRRGQLQEARDRFEQGLAVLRPLDDSLALADVLTLVSPVMTSLGEADQALQYANEGLRAARATGDAWRIAYALMMQAGIFAGWGRYDQASTSAHEALSRFRGLGDTRLIVVTLNTLGFVALQSSRYAEAREHLMESLALTASSDDPWSAGTAYGNLGIAELGQGNPVEAKALLQMGIPLFADLGMLGDVAYFMNYLGDAAFMLGEIEEAENHWLDAIRIAHENQAWPTALAILVRLAQLYAGRGHLIPAFEWATLVSGHPAAWQDSRDRARKLREELMPKVASHQAEITDRPFGQKSLELVIQEILARSKDENGGA